jgi:hypothetical protein
LRAWCAATIAVAALVAHERVARANPNELPPPSVLVGASAGAQYLPVDLGSLTLVPIALELGIRLPDGLEMGGGLEGAPSIGGRCSPCRGWTGRSAFHVREHLSPDTVLDPWVGVATGFELVSMPGQVGVATASPFYGFDLPSLELGLDASVNPRLRVGAFVRGDFVVLYRTFDGADTPAWMTNNVPARASGGVRAVWSLPMAGVEGERAPRGTHFVRRRGGVLLGMGGFVLGALSSYFAVAGFTAKHDAEGIATGVGVLGLIGVAFAIPMMVVGFGQDTVVLAKD